MGPLALTPSLLYSTLVHKATDNTILSICFSPDGELLATGAMDGVVQVSSGTFIPAVVIVVVVVVIFKPNAQHRTTSGVLDLGCCQEANPQQFPGSHWQDGLLALSLMGREIACLWVVQLYDEDLGYDGWVVEDPCNYRQRWCLGFKRGCQLRWTNGSRR